MTSLFVGALTTLGVVVVALLQREPSAKRLVDVMLKESELIRTMRDNNAPVEAISAMERAHVARAERYAGPTVTPAVLRRGAGRRLLVATALGVGASYVLSLAFTRLPATNLLDSLLLIAGLIGYVMAGSNVTITLRQYMRARAAARPPLSRGVQGRS